jgi:hypothetical protein
MGVGKIPWLAKIQLARPRPYGKQLLLLTLTKPNLLVPSINVNNTLKSFIYKILKSATKITTTIIIWKLEKLVLDDVTGLPTANVDLFVHKPSDISVCSQIKNRGYIKAILQFPKFDTNIKLQICKICIM